jgi:hypothetical protein
MEVTNAYAQGRGRFMVAWDRISNHGAKCYALYRNAVECLRSLLTCELNNRFGYEVMPPGTRIRGYMDVEYVAPPDPVHNDSWHHLMDMILDYFTRKAMELYNIKPDFRVLSSCRPDEATGLIKFSFHIIIANLVFENNHDKTMQSFFAVTEDMGDDWFWTDKAGKRKPIVDQAVYTRKRCFRLPLCSKRGKLIPLLPLSNDCSKSKGLVLHDLTPEQLADYLVTTMSESYFLVDSVQTEPKSPSPAKTKSKPRAATQTPTTSSPEPDSPLLDWPSHIFSKSDLERLLESNGDNVTRLTTVTLLSNGTYKVQGNQRKRLRPCLHNRGFVHTNNNALLFVTPRLDGFCDVMYHCTGSTCCKLKQIALGGISGPDVKPASNPVAEEEEQTTPSDFQEGGKYAASPEYLAKQLSRYVGAISDRSALVDVLVRIASAYDAEKLCLDALCQGVEERGELVSAWNYAWAGAPKLLGNPMLELQAMYIQASTLSLTKTIPRVPHLQADMENQFPYVSIPPLKERVIALKAQCGMGKTKAMHAFLEAEQPDFAIFVTHRKSLSRDALQRLPALRAGSKGPSPKDWVVYDSIKGRIRLSEHRFVIIQYESLARLALDGCENFTLIMDEVCSIFKQMESGAGDHYAAQVVFSRLCLKAKRILAMDGHLDQQRVDVLSRYCTDEVFVIHNRFQRKLDQNYDIRFTDDRKMTIEYVVDLLQKGERVHCPCLCKALARQIFQVVKQKFGESKVAQLYTGDDQMDPTVDINEEWGKADIVIHTCTIDCGVSFEREKHFGYCVAFVNNHTKIDHETIIQMMSRSRDTPNNLVCVEDFNYPQKPTDLQSILDEVQPDIIANRNATYFGVVVANSERGLDTVDRCCPYLLNHITNESISRRASNNLSLELMKLLLEEGALCLWMEFPANVPDLSEEIQAAKTACTDANPEYLCENYPGTERYVFDAMAPVDRAMYATTRLRDMFTGLNLLRAHGPDFPTALTNLTAKQEHLTVALQACAASERFDQNTLAMAEIKSGVRGGSKSLAFKIAGDTFCLFTGAADPYKLDEIYQSVIQTRLQCSPIEEGSNKMFLSQQITRTLAIAYQNWMAIDPLAYTPSHVVYCPDRVAFPQALTILNQILKRMFAMMLVPTRKQKRCRGEAADHLLVMDKYSYFAERVYVDKVIDLNGVQTPVSLHPDKPSLNPWNPNVKTRLYDEDVLLTRNFMDSQMIAVSDAYLPSNAGGTSNDENFRSVKEGDVFDLCLHWNPSATMTYDFKMEETNTEVEDINARLLSVCRDKRVSRGAPMKTRVKQPISEEMRLKNKLAKQKERRIKAERLKTANESQQENQKDLVLEAYKASIQQQKDKYDFDQQQKREDFEREKNQKKFQRKVVDRFENGKKSHEIQQKVIDCFCPALKRHKAA